MERRFASHSSPSRIAKRSLSDEEWEANRRSIKRRVRAGIDDESSGGRPQAVARSSEAAARRPKAVDGGHKRFLAQEIDRKARLEQKRLEKEAKAKEHAEQSA